MPNKKRVITVKLTKEYKYPIAMLGPVHNIEDLAKQTAISDMGTDIMERNGEIQQGFFDEVSIKDNSISFKNEPPVIFRNSTLNDICKAFSKNIMEKKYGPFNVELNPSIYNIENEEWGRDEQGNEVLIREEAHYLKEKIEDEWYSLQREYANIIQPIMFPEDVQRAAVNPQSYGRKVGIVDYGAELNRLQEMQRTGYVMAEAPMFYPQPKAQETAKKPVKKEKPRW